MFSTFPGGLPSLGLLLLRMTLGVTALIQGGTCLSAKDNLLIWIFGIVAIANGALLLIGFLTPVTSTLMCLFGVSRALLLLLSAPNPHLLESNLPNIYVMIISAALILLGPGAMSLDARLFGRREIIIPSNPRPPKS